MSWKTLNWHECTLQTGNKHWTAGFYLLRQNTICSGNVWCCECVGETWQVQTALENLMTAQCPPEILTTEGRDVKYSQNFEDDNSQVGGRGRRGRRRRDKARKVFVQFVIVLCVCVLTSLTQKKKERRCSTLPSVASGPWRTHRFFSKTPTPKLLEANTIRSLWVNTQW